MLGKNKNKLLSYWGKNNKILSLKREANNLINLRKQIITGEYKYRSVISKLSKIKMIIEMVEYYKPCDDTKKLNIKIFINTTKTCLKKWSHVVNDPGVQHAVKEKYGNEKLSKMIKDQNYYYPEYDHKIKWLNMKIFTILNIIIHWVCISYHKKPLLKNQSHDKEMVLKY